MTGRQGSNSSDHGFISTPPVAAAPANPKDAQLDSSPIPRHTIPEVFPASQPNTQVIHEAYLSMQLTPEPLGIPSLPDMEPSLTRPAEIVPPYEAVKPVVNRDYVIIPGRAGGKAVRYKQPQNPDGPAFVIGDIGQGTLICSKCGQIFKPGGSHANTAVEGGRELNLLRNRAESHTDSCTGQTEAIREKLVELEVDRAAYQARWDTWMAENT